MGMYINPPVSEFGPAAKESWLQRQMNIKHTAKEITRDEFLKADWDEANSRNKLYLVLIDNFGFTALLVCDINNELEYMQRNCSKDQRVMYFIECDKETALEYAA